MARGSLQILKRKIMKSIKIWIMLSLLGSCFSIINADDWNITKLRMKYQKPINQWPKPETDSGVKFQEMEAVTAIEHEKTDLIKLGIRFFNEPRFSTSMELSCATCHAPNKAFTEHTSVSAGHNGLKGGRNSPTLYGAVDGTHFFWDGSASSLEEQALGPIANPVEMAMPINKLKEKIKTMSGYDKDLQIVFGDTNLTLNRIATAIAAYERTIKPTRTKFDEFIDGNVTALDDRELLGLHLFRTKARCMNCHSGKYLTDGEFHNLGLTYYEREKYEDLGRYNITKDNNATGKFKTPTLRQVTNTAPYMHNGIMPSLRGIINAYNAGMFNVKPHNEKQKVDPRFPKKSILLKKLELNSDEKIALLLFLKTL